MYRANAARWRRGVRWPVVNPDRHTQQTPCPQHQQPDQWQRFDKRRQTEKQGAEQGDDRADPPVHLPWVADRVARCEEPPNNDTRYCSNAGIGQHVEERDHHRTFWSPSGRSYHTLSWMVYASAAIVPPQFLSSLAADRPTPGQRVARRHAIMGRCGGRPRARPPDTRERRGLGWRCR